MCVPRYYPLFPRAFTITKRLTAEQCPLTDDLRESVLAAHDLAELYDIMGRDYWCVFGWLPVVCAAEALTVCVVQGGVSVPLPAPTYETHRSIHQSGLCTSQPVMRRSETA